MNRLKYMQNYPCEQVNPLTLSYISKKSCNRFCKIQREQNRICRHNKQPIFIESIKKHRAKNFYKGSEQHTQNKDISIQYLNNQNPTESTQAYQQQSFKKTKASKSPKKFIKNFQTGFQLIKKQKILKDMISKSLSLEESIKIFNIGSANAKVLQQLVHYNKVNFQLLLKLIYYHGYRYSHLKYFLRISFKKVSTYQQFYDVLLEETGLLGRVLNQNLSMIIEKKILNANKKFQTKQSSTFEYFKFFSKLKRKFQKVFNIIYEHFQYIESIFFQIDKVVQLYQKERNNDICQSKLNFGQYVRKSLINTAFSEKHILKFLLEANQFFKYLDQKLCINQQSGKTKCTNFYDVNPIMKKQLNEILQNIKEAQFSCEQIPEENSDYYDDMYGDEEDDDDDLSYTQSQLEEERQLIEFRKQQKKKEKRKRRKQKKQEKKQKIQVQILMQQQEESCQNLKSIISNISQIYKKVKFDKLKLKLDPKDFKSSNYFKVN